MSDWEHVCRVGMFACGQEVEVWFQRGTDKSVKNPYAKMLDRILLRHIRDDGKYTHTYITLADFETITAEVQRKVGKL